MWPLRYHLSQDEGETMDEQTLSQAFSELETVLGDRATREKSHRLGYIAD